MYHVIRAVIIFTALNCFTLGLLHDGDDPVVAQGGGHLFASDLAVGGDLVIIGAALGGLQGDGGLAAAVHNLHLLIIALGGGSAIDDVALGVGALLPGELHLAGGLGGDLEADGRLQRGRGGNGLGELRLAIGGNRSDLEIIGGAHVETGHLEVILGGGANELEGGFRVALAAIDLILGGILRGVPLDLDAVVLQAAGGDAQLPRDGGDHAGPADLMAEIAIAHLGAMLALFGLEGDRPGAAGFHVGGGQAGGDEDAFALGVVLIGDDVGEVDPIAVAGLQIGIHDQGLAGLAGFDRHHQGVILGGVDGDAGGDVVFPALIEIIRAGFGRGEGDGVEIIIVNMEILAQGKGTRGGDRGRDGIDVGIIRPERKARGGGHLRHGGHRGEHQAENHQQRKEFLHSNVTS